MVASFVFGLVSSVECVGEYAGLTIFFDLFLAYLLRVQIFGVEIRSGNSDIVKIRYTIKLNAKDTQDNNRCFDVITTLSDVI